MVLGSGAPESPRYGGGEVSGNNYEVAADESTVYPVTLDAPEVSDGMSMERRRIIAKVRDLAAEVTETTKHIFHDSFDDLPANDPKRRARIKEFLVEKGLDCPHFKLRFGQEAVDMLVEAGLEDRLGEGEEEKGVLLFQLPKPLAQYWAKGKGRWGAGGLDLKGTVIEWGRIYREVTPFLWDAMDDAFEEGLILQRLNEVGEHDTERYYYVWLIDPQ